MMPIPAPGTAELLKGVPLASSPIQAELTTPTGAAILTTVVQQWVEQPVMQVEQIGHGAGKRDLPEQPNLLRLFVGQAASVPSWQSPTRSGSWTTNLDDLPAEVIGYCYDLLLAAGALDVYSTPIFMKKNRPGTLLSVLADEAALPALEAILFRETMTFGIRRYPVSRHKQNRRACTVSTPWGPVQGKLGWLEGRPPVFTPEYEDCARVARQHGVALREVYTQARQAYKEEAHKNCLSQRRKGAKNAAKCFFALSFAPLRLCERLSCSARLFEMPSANDIRQQFSTFSSRSTATPRCRRAASCRSTTRRCCSPTPA